MVLWLPQSLVRSSLLHAFLPDALFYYGAGTLLSIRSASSREESPLSSLPRKLHLEPLPELPREPLPDNSHHGFPQQVLHKLIPSSQLLQLPYALPAALLLRMYLPVLFPLTPARQRSLPLPIQILLSQALLSSHLQSESLRSLCAPAPHEYPCNHQASSLFQMYRSYRLPLTGSVPLQHEAVLLLSLFSPYGPWSLQAYAVPSL